MDLLRSDMRPAEALSGTERDARIEQLLLAGLDEYFAHRYEQAINIWTRVLFLDRGHDRARAYIERARSAQAELQRESEAVLHEGIEAFHDGDVARARRLVVDALDRGASRDVAQGMLERIERLGAGRTAPRLRRRVVLSAPDEESDHRIVPRRRSGWIAAVLLFAASLGVLAVGVWGVAIPEPATWTIFTADTLDATGTAMPMALEPLPLPDAADSYLSRARSLSATGRLHDALAAIDRIPPADPLHAEADRLRAVIQRHLLAVAASERLAAQPSDRLSARPPE